MQGKTLYTILLSIIAVLTLALAVLVILIFTVYSGNRAVPPEETKEITERVVPAGERAEFRVYGGESGDAVFNLKSTEKNPSSYLSASVSIIFDGGKKNRKLETRKALIEKNLSLLQMETIEYFINLSLEDLQAPDAIKKVRTDLKSIYNGIVSVESDELIVIDVVFDRWNYSSQG